MRLIGLLMAVASVCAGGVVACSSPSAAPPPPVVNGTDAAPDDSGVVDCTTDPLAETYAPNMQQSGKGGLKFVLVKVMNPTEQGTMVEGPPAVGTNTWTLKLLDQSGAPITNATFPPGTIAPWPAAWPVGVYPYMPKHGHGSSAWPMITNNMDGTYTIDNVYLFMAGLWQININVKAGTQADSTVFGFCVQG
jgi:hypothetical protein